MNVFVLLFVILLTPANTIMPKPRITEDECQYVGHEKGWKWLGVVGGEEMSANANMLWECEAGCGATRSIRLHNLKAKGKKHQCAVGLAATEDVADEAATTTEDVADAAVVAVPLSRGRKVSVNETICHGVALRNDLHWLGLLDGDTMSSLAIMRWSRIQYHKELPPYWYAAVRRGKIPSHICGSGASH